METALSIKQKCVDPPGEVKPRGWIWLQIAKRLGFAEDYSPLLANVPDDKWDENCRRTAAVKLTANWVLREEIIPLNPPSWEEFQKKPVFRWEVKDRTYTYKNTMAPRRESV